MKPLPPVTSERGKAIPSQFGWQLEDSILVTDSYGSLTALRPCRVEAHGIVCTKQNIDRYRVDDYGQLWAQDSGKRVNSTRRGSKLHVAQGPRGILGAVELAQRQVLV